MKKDSAACSTSMPRPSETPRPGLFRRGQKRRLASVHHVVGKNAAAQQPRRQRRRLVGETRRGGIDHQIEFARQALVALSGGAREALGQRFGL